MPYIVTGDLENRLDSYTSDLTKVDYGYRYPKGLNLKPGSELHNKLRSNLIRRAQDARVEMSKRFDSWNEIDRLLTTYVHLKDSEILLQEKDPNKPVTIVFPYTYSMLEALLTYLTLAFFQDPIFQYEGVGPEDVRGAMLLELVIRLHCIKTKVALSIHTALRDSLSYGIGISVPKWVTKQGKKAIRSSVTLSSDFLTTEQTQLTWVDDILFEGNGLDSIDPYLWLPDPSVSSGNIQDAEFLGWLVRDNYMNVLSEESIDQTLFNAKYLRHVKDKRSILALDCSDRNKKYNTSKDANLASLNPVDKLYMYVNLIPKEWKLGKSEYPEKWLFCLAADEIILAARPLELAHNMYPVAVASPEFDGYSSTPLGRIEILTGLQKVLDWLFNSHITNVRKAINDMFIVDPYLVNIEDIRDPKPGKLIRLRRPAWGKGVDKVVQQFAVTDITANNIVDSTYITQWMDRISGADQSMVGSLRTRGPERLTSTEFQGTRGAAISRLQRLAMLISLQYFQDLGTMFAVHTQQFMSRETYVKAVGRHAEQLASIFGPNARIPVTPYDLAIDYDVIVRDGSIPGGNFSDAWVQLFQIIGSSPELMANFDITRIFSFIATQLGAKDVESFKRINPQVQTMSDEEVLRQTQAGNMIPLRGLGV